MPRYIDRDEFWNKRPENLNRNKNDYCRGWDDYANEIYEELKDTPIADVVPRSEVEKAKQEAYKEVFEQFESHISTGIRILKDCINDTDTDQVKRHLLGRLHELCGMEKFIAELEKKYIGG